MTKDTPIVVSRETQPRQASPQARLQSSLQSRPRPADAGKLAGELAQDVHAAFDTIAAACGRLDEAAASSASAREALDEIRKAAAAGGNLLRQVLDYEALFARLQKLHAVGEFAAGVAHDFNNILTGVMGFADLLGERLRADAMPADEVDSINESARRGAALVRRLLAFSRRQDMTPEAFAVSDSLESVRPLVERLLSEKVRLAIESDDADWRVFADKGQFEQVLINLAVNARDAMPDGGALTMRTRHEHLPTGRGPLIPSGDYVVCEVEDTGHGIPAAILGQIFEPYFTTKPVGVGAGLGLSMAYGIIKQCGGFIFPESEQGKGTRFVVWLPRSAAEPKPAEQPTEAAAVASAQGEGATLLLVEDEAAVRAFASAALRAMGWRVIEARDGEHALAMARSGEAPECALVVSDIAMPGLDGPGLMAALQPLWKNTRFLFISGYAENAFGEAGRPDPAHAGFLPKPFTLAELRRAVARETRRTDAAKDAS